MKSIWNQTQFQALSKTQLPILAHQQASNFFLNCLSGEVDQLHHQQQHSWCIWVHVKKFQANFLQALSCSSSPKRRRFYKFDFCLKLWISWASPTNQPLVQAKLFVELFSFCKLAEVEWLSFTKIWSSCPLSSFLATSSPDFVHNNVKIFIVRKPENHGQGERERDLKEQGFWSCTTVGVLQGKWWQKQQGLYVGGEREKRVNGAGSWIVCVEREVGENQKRWWRGRGRGRGRWRRERKHLIQVDEANDHNEDGVDGEGRCNPSDDQSSSYMKHEGKRPPMTWLLLLLLHRWWCSSSIIIDCTVACHAFLFFFLHSCRSCWRYSSLIWRFHLNSPPLSAAATCSRQSANSPAAAEWFLHTDDRLMCL